MTRRDWIFISVLLAIGLVVGCATYTDPETGERLYGLGPGADSAVMAIGEAAEQEQQSGAIASLARMINPAAGAIVDLTIGAIVAGFIVYKRGRSKYLKQETLLTKVSQGAVAAGEVIEEVVKPMTAEWAKARTTMKTAERNGAINPDKLATT